MGVGVTGVVKVDAPVVAFGPSGYLAVVEVVGGHAVEKRHHSLIGDVVGVVRAVDKPLVAYRDPAAALIVVSLGSGLCQTAIS